MDPATAETRARGVGIGSVAIGAGLLSARRRIEGVAELGSRDLVGIALVDLAVGLGLIRGRRRRPWLFARGVANLWIGALLIRRGSRPGQLIAAALGVLTVADLRVATALDDGTPAGEPAAGAGAPSLSARFSLAASEAINDRGIYLGRRSTKVHVAVYRRSGGRLGGSVPGWPTAKVVLVDHRGARTGARRTSPLMYHRDGEAIVVVASKAGGPKNPAWFHNLMANPETTVQIGNEVRQVRARLATEAERRRLWPELDAVYPGYVTFRKRARPREIPIVLLEPPASGDG